MKLFQKVKPRREPKSPRAGAGGGGGGLGNSGGGSGGQPRGTALREPCDLDNIWGEVESMVGEPLRSLPIHKDLHRLASSTAVWDASGRRLNGHDLFAEDELDDRKKRFVSTKRVLWALASTVDPTKRDTIMTAFDEIVVSGSVNDIAGSMIDFLKALDDGNVVVPQLRTLRILKLVNQAILAPAVIHLNFFLAKSPEKETYMNAGPWKIDINFHKDGRVSVCHTKSEKAKDSSFKWHLKMTLNESFSMLEEATLSFLKVHFPATEQGEARRQAFLKYIGYFYSGQQQIAEKERDMWVRPHHSLPIHKSLPGVALRATVTAGDAELFVSNPEAPSDHNIKYLLIALARLFAPSKEEVISAEFDKHYQKNDAVTSLRFFLREILKVSDEEENECRGFTAVLKTLHSSVVAPCLSLLYERLIALADPSSPLAVLPGFRESGDWVVTIRVRASGAGHGEEHHDLATLDSESSGEPNDVEEEQDDHSDKVKNSVSSSSSAADNKRWVTVRHTRGAASAVPSNASNYVEFGWYVEMDLDRELKRMTGVRMRVDDIRFGSNVDGDLHQEITALLHRAVE